MAGIMKKYWIGGDISRKKNADIVVLGMPLLNTRQGRDLRGTFIADIVLQLLSYVAQTEMKFIRQHLAEEIAAAKAKRNQFWKKAKARHQTFLKWTREVEQ